MLEEADLGIWPEAKSVLGSLKRAQLHSVSGLFLLIIGAADALAGLPALAPEQLPLQQLHQHVEPGPQIIPPPCTPTIASKDHPHGHKNSIRTSPTQQALTAQRR